MGGKLLVATSGGSPLKPSEIVLLEVDSVDALKASTPDQWQVLQRSSKALVRLILCPRTHVLSLFPCASLNILLIDTSLTQYDDFFRLYGTLGYLLQTMDNHVGYSVCKAC